MVPEKLFWAEEENRLTGYDIMNQEMFTFFTIPYLGQ